MNVYDFDKTIYDGDSTLDFYLFSLKKKPSLILYLPIQALGFIKYVFGIYCKLEFKEKFYSFLIGIPNIDEVVEVFWKEKQFKIKNWYFNNKKHDDLVISASPEFLLKQICCKLEIKDLVASKINKYNGTCESKNCYGIEKVIRFMDEYTDEAIDEFYSDSLSDEPLAKLAKKSYVVCGEKLIKWSEYKPNGIKKLKMLFFTKQFIVFLIIGFINTLNGILFSYLYSVLLDVNLSFILGYVTSLGISYILNSSFVFKENFKFVRYIKFYISYIPNFIIQNVMVLTLYNLLEFNKLLVFILSAIIGVPVTFFLMKIFAFKKKD